MAQILIADDEEIILELLQMQLSREGDHDISVACSPEEAIQILMREKIQIAVLDFDFIGSPLDGVDIYTSVQDSTPDTYFILNSANPHNVQQKMGGIYPNSSEMPKNIIVVSGKPDTKVVRSEIKRILGSK
jgi:DNA-binding NtrC family response regulator